MVDEGHTRFGELLGAVLSGQKDWDEFYSSRIEAFETGAQPQEIKWFTDLLIREKTAFRHLWEGDFPTAAMEYASLAKDADTDDNRLGAWYHHWEGLAYDMAGNEAKAVQAYLRAANERAELGRPQIRKGVVVTSGDIEPGQQARNIASLIEKSKGKWVSRVNKVVSELVYGSESNPIEQALCDLGTILGLEASRPERQYGTGPDVLWRYPPDNTGAALEAKTNKGPESQYRKKEDIGQFHDHVQWLEETFAGGSFLKIIVGRKLRVSSGSNPPKDLQVITLEQFQGLAQRVYQLLEFVESSPHEPNTEVCVQRGLQSLGLIWPACLESLEAVLAIDLKSDQSDLVENNE